MYLSAPPAMDRHGSSMAFPAFRGRGCQCGDELVGVRRCCLPNGRRIIRRRHKGTRTSTVDNTCTGAHGNRARRSNNANANSREAPQLPAKSNGRQVWWDFNAATMVCVSSPPSTSRTNCDARSQRPLYRHAVVVKHGWQLPGTANRKRSAQSIELRFDDIGVLAQPADGWHWTRALSERLRRLSNTAPDAARRRPRDEKVDCPGVTAIAPAAARG